MAATNKYGMSMRKWPEKDSLFFKFQGHSAKSLDETAAVVKSVVEKHGGFGFTLAKDDQEATSLWADRKNALFSGLALLEGDDGKGWSTDVWYVLTALSVMTIFEVCLQCATVESTTTCLRDKAGPRRNRFDIDNSWSCRRRKLSRSSAIQNRRRAGDREARCS